MDGAVVGHGLGAGAAVAGKAPGDEKLLQGAEAGAQIVAQGNGHGDSPKPPAHAGGALSLQVSKPPVQEHQQHRHRPRRRQGIARHDGRAGVGEIPRHAPAQQEHGDAHRGDLVADFHGHQLAHLSAGREAAGQHGAQAVHRQGDPQKPQALNRLHVPHPQHCHRLCQDQQQPAYQGAQRQSRAQAPGHGLAHAAKAAVAVLLRREGQRRHPQPRGAQGHGKKLHGGDELQQSHPRRPHPGGEVDLKEHAHPPHQEIGRRQKPHVPGDGSLPHGHPLPLSPYAGEGGGYAKGRI